MGVDFGRRRINSRKKKKKRKKEKKKIYLLYKWTETNPILI